MMNLTVVTVMQTAPDTWIAAAFYETPDGIYGETIEVPGTFATEALALEAADLMPLSHDFTASACVLEACER
jgi:hypothetical protein